MGMGPERGDFDGCRSTQQASCIPVDRCNGEVPWSGGSLDTCLEALSYLTSASCAWSAFRQNLVLAAQEFEKAKDTYEEQETETAITLRVRMLKESADGAVSALLEAQAKWLVTSLPAK